MSTIIKDNNMHSSYSLHAHIPSKKKPEPRRRKRKILPVIEQYSSLKYRCYQCSADVYFLPGHELVCSKCASRTVEKINENPKKYIVSSR